MSTSRRYEVTSERAASFIVRSEDGRLCVLVPLGSTSSATSRATRAFSIRCIPEVTIELPERQWTTSAAVLECIDETLSATFDALVADIDARLAPLASRSWGDVLAIIEEWEELLRAARKPTPSQELGLWGELYLLSRSADPGFALAAWRGPTRHVVDFFASGIAVECKTFDPSPLPLSVAEPGSAS